MIKKLLPVVFLFLIHNISAQGPEVTSWIINPGGEVGYNNIPSNVLLVQYTTNDVYISCASVPAYLIGPWSGNPNEPSDQDFVF